MQSQKNYQNSSQTLCICIWMRYIWSYVTLTVGFDIVLHFLTNSGFKFLFPVDVSFPRLSWVMPVFPWFLGSNSGIFGGIPSPHKNSMPSDYYFLLQKLPHERNLCRIVSLLVYILL